MADYDEYHAVRSFNETVFDMNARFPDQVFRKPAGDSLFGEFDFLLTPKIWPALCSVARLHGDDRIELVVLEPDGGDFYLSQGLGYPAVSLSVEASADDYWAEVGFEPDGDALGSITISANVVAITGASGKWGCWGERDIEVAVFQGFPDEATRRDWWEQFGPFLEVSDALETYISSAFYSAPMPDAFIKALTTNYRSAFSGAVTPRNPHQEFSGVSDPVNTRYEFAELDSLLQSSDSIDATVRGTGAERQDSRDQDQPSTAQGRPLSPVEDNLLGNIFSPRFPGSVQLLRQLEVARVIGPWTWGEGSVSIDIAVPPNYPPASTPDGIPPVDVKVYDDMGSYFGELIARIAGGYISELKLTWVTDDPPQYLPRNRDIRVIYREGPMR
ncbi:hypothetical protein ACFQ3B_15590 [Stackebrandtia endophytica]|uniref:hypothetical protein n=1 Tax=Stackebrandtia endophytica TaxID=1496996 RepID=UPI001B8788E5|nr:hypothetical protein [Stackebrandtia endophytica]